MDDHGSALLEAIVALLFLSLLSAAGYRLIGTSYEAVRHSTAQYRRHSRQQHLTPDAPIGWNCLEVAAEGSLSVLSCSTTEHSTSPLLVITPRKER